MLARADEVLRRGGRHVTEFDATARGVHAQWMSLESARAAGPWFRWASVGVDSAASLAEQAGMLVKEIRAIEERVVANLVAR